MELKTLWKNVHPFILSKWTFGYVLLTVLVGSFIYFGYQIAVVNPATQRQIQNEEEAAKQTQNAVNNYKYSQCLSEAQTTYSDMWAQNCVGYGEKEQEGYASCRENEDATFCISLYGDPSTFSDTNCSLPLTLADSLDSNLKDAKADCLKEYPQK